MKFSKRTLILILAILGLVATGSVIYLQTTESKSLEYSNVTPQKAKEMINTDNIVILDVRTRSEFENSHIPDAILFPLKKIENSSLGFSKNQKILVVCKTGYRSSIFAEKLVKRGYENVYNLQGGITGWVEDGFEVISTPEDKEKKIAPGSVAPDFDLNINGNIFSLNNHREDILLLDFLFAQCQPCIQEVEELKKIRENYPNLIILSIGTDNYELEQLKDEENANWPFIASPDVQLDYGVETYPTIFIIGDNNVVRYKHEGLIFYSEISNELENLVF